MISYKERLPKISTFFFSVDGVFTTGEITLFNNTVIRTFHSKDEYAVQRAVEAGYRVIVLTRSSSMDVKERLESLGARVHLNVLDKLAAYQQIQEEIGFTDEQVLAMGDDVPDLGLLKIVGMSACPQDAVPEVKALCHYQAPLNGGKGVVRDVIEQTMRVQGKWSSEVL